jgi:hypothetical protein
MNAQSNEERLARLETTLEHLATKEDVLGLRTELKGDVQSLRAEMLSLKAELQRTIFWAIGFSVTFMTAVIALATAAQIIVK